MKGATEGLKARLLAVMVRKRHPSYEAFVAGRLTRAQILAQYEQEWVVYMRDYPVMLSRILALGPPEGVRRLLAETIYEESTGGLSGSAPHTALFLRLMRALGGEREQFESAEMTLESAAYRAHLDGVVDLGWLPAFAVLMLFVDGTANDAAVLARDPRWEPDEAALDAILSRHPLVRHCGVGLDAMLSARVHLRVAARRRHSAWEGVLGHAGDKVEAVVEAVEAAQASWMSYRDGIARLWGLGR